VSEQPSKLPHERGKPKLPTRVIDVGLKSEITTVKLHISHATEFEEYVALSYCWRSPQPLVTTAENLASDMWYPSRTAAANLPSFTPGGSLGKVFVMRQLAHNSMHPLNKRGWALQEALLSPRKLLYGERELVWYCEFEQSKQFPGSALQSFYMFGILPPEVFQQDGDVQIRPPNDHKLWSRIVNVCSGCGIGIFSVSSAGFELLASTGTPAESC
jgi:hypothetical protein